MTEGKELFVETWDENSSSYLSLKELPNYQDLMTVNNFKLDHRETFVYKRRRFEDFTTKENLDLIKGNFTKRLTQQIIKIPLSPTGGIPSWQ